MSMWRRRIMVWAMGLALGLSLSGWTLAQAEESQEPQKKPAKKQVLQGPKVDGQRGQGGRGFDGRGGPGPHGPIIQALRDMNLAQEQKDQIRQIMADHHTKAKAHREANAEELQKLNQEFKAAREAKDHEKIKSIAQQRQKLMEGAPKPADLINQIKGVLNEEQATTFQALLDAEREQMGPGPHRMRHAPGKGEGEGKAKMGPDGADQQGQGKPPRQERRGGDDKKLDF